MDSPALCVRVCVSCLRACVRACACLCCRCYHCGDYLDHFLIEQAWVAPVARRTATRHAARHYNTASAVHRALATHHSDSAAPHGCLVFATLSRQLSGARHAVCAQCS
jgi:hypothetical protein